jgi:uncharacterized membrane protein YkvI
MDVWSLPHWRIEVLWLAAVDGTLLLGVAAVITALGGVTLPFLIPLATRVEKSLQAQVLELTRRVDECEQREKNRGSGGGRRRSSQASR